MLCLLVHRCRIQLSYKALRLIVHYWEDVPNSVGAAEGLLIRHMMEQPRPLSIVSAVLMAIRSEIKERQKKKSTSHLEEGLSRFGLLQAALLNHLQELMRGSGGNQGDKLLRLAAIIDPKPWEQGAGEQGSSSATPSKQHYGGSSGGDDHLRALTLSDFRPLRVAFSDSDATFMSTPLVETFTRLAWLGQEFVLVRDCS